jgi:acyl-homoserine lactone acylase PvdQ
MRAFALAPVLAPVALFLAACGSSSTPFTPEVRVPVDTSVGGVPVVAKDGVNIFMTSMPPGSNGNTAGGVGDPATGNVQQYPANFRDQLDQYGNLAYARTPMKSDTCAPPKNFAAHAKQSDLACNYFKPGNIELNPADAVRTTTLTAANGKPVTIRRDGWGTPYIDGADRQSAQYGLGYAAAEDRLWLFDILRALGRGRVSEKLGPSPTTDGLDAEFSNASSYSEAELTNVANNAVAKLGANGTLFLSDAQAFVAGMNAYIAFLQTPAGANQMPQEYRTLAVGLGAPKFPPPAFTVNDMVANAVLIQSALGLGGGGEPNNVRLLQALDASIGPDTTTLPQTACELWRDFRHANIKDTFYAASGTFATQSPPSVSEECPQALGAGVIFWDKDSLRSRPIFRRTASTGVVKHQPKKLPKLQTLLAQELKRATPQDKASLALALAGDDPGSRLKAVLNELGMPKTSSNWIAAAASQTESGHPIVVEGPQTGYFNPQLLWEASLISRGGTPLDMAVRGISTVNLPYLVIGHGVDFAWSPTSAGSDFTDTRVSKMCNLAGSPLGATPSRDDLKNNTTGAAGADGFPDADGYEYQSQCVRFYRNVDTWFANPTVTSQALGGSMNPQRVERFAFRTHYGPVFATATVKGAPVAVSSQRSTFLSDVDTTTPFALMPTTGIRMDHTRFKKLFNNMTATFNWLYSDKRDIAFIQSGLYPKRAAGHDPQLPVWGDGRFEWVVDQSLPANFFTEFGGNGNTGGKPYPSRTKPVLMDDQGYYEYPGFLPLEAHIQDTNPPAGYMANWNNSGAKGWYAPDGNGTYGPTHRVKSLSLRLDAFKASGRKHTMATMVEIMADGAYTDLRGLDVLPDVMALMRNGTLTPDQRTALDLWQAWIDDGSQKWIDGGKGLGALRRDRDANGIYDHRAAVVLTDAFFIRAHSALVPQITALDAQGVGVLTGRFDAPRAQGSAFQQGWFQHIKRVVQMAQGTQQETYRQLKCAGTGMFNDCRTAALNALNQAIADLGGISNQANWDGRQLVNAQGIANTNVENYDSTRHTSFSFLPVPAIHWINRPTYQTAAEIFRDRDGKN